MWLQYLLTEMGQTWNFLSENKDIYYQRNFVW